MVFLAQKIRRKFEGSPTFVVLTDRDELNTQISDTFENCGLLGKAKASQIYRIQRRRFGSEAKKAIRVSFSL